MYRHPLGPLTMEGGSNEQRNASISYVQSNRSRDLRKRNKTDKEICPDFDAACTISRL